MPELPEVETVKRTLELNILNKKIGRIDVYYDKIIHGTYVEKFKESLKGLTIISINRKGKYMYFGFDNDTFMISHLRMEGKYYIKKQEEPKEKHEHIIFHFTDGIDLRYADVRKFGVMELKNKADLLTTPPLSLLGPDAYQLDADYLFKAIRKKAPIKSVLLEQNLIAGIGNIYADEILFMAKINPTRPANDLTLDDCKNIALYSKEIMEQAIIAGGTTVRSYTSSLGVTGRFQVNLNVHTKENEPCKICGSIIKKTRVGGRGTYYCPNCQNK